MAERASEETVEDTREDKISPPGKKDVSHETTKNNGSSNRQRKQKGNYYGQRNYHQDWYYRDSYHGYREHQRYYYPPRNQWRNKKKSTPKEDNDGDKSAKETSKDVVEVIIHKEPKGSESPKVSQKKPKAPQRKNKWNSDRPRGGGGHRKAVTPSAQSDELCQQLLGGVYECMVCCERLKSHQEVWSCPCCYHIFHLKCIGRWAKSPAATAVEDHPEKGWRCPGCRTVSTHIPSLYKCFCGRVTNPDQFRRRGDLTVPHSCGEPCRKDLATSPESSCTHKCPQLCHPGPCPPCPVMVTRKCPCGKSSSSVRCSQNELLPSCGEVCARELSCNQHKCGEICHEGPCPQCEVPLLLKCHCGRETKQALCGEVSGRSSYACNRICNKPLDCGNHTCESFCHPGNCSSCQLLPSLVTHCPCGATPIKDLLPVGTMRTSCLDDVPLCQNKCLRPLPCSAYSPEGKDHLCSSNCHHGECPPCTLTSVALCKCGRTEDKVPCSKVNEREGFTCSKQCGKKLSCGRHRCQKICCVSESHVCQRTCGRKHDCGRHSCQDVCHPGKCGPCWNISYEELTCLCGGEVMLPPIPCGTAPPTCSRPCNRMHSCDHPVTHSCHSDDVCPPCTFLTDKMCMGGHTERNYIPCHIKDISCGRPCGKPLSCGMHTCLKLCHKGSCQKDDGDVCRQPCTLGRKYCSHVCGSPCHVGSPCPDVPCKAKIVLQCSCGRKREKVLCLVSGANITSQTFHKVYSSELGTIMRQIQEGQSIEVDSLVMKPPNVRNLECDEICAQMERNRMLAEALELTDVDHSPDMPPQYSVFLLEQVRENPSLVSSIESIFKELIEVFNGQKVGSSTHSFKPMKRNQRRIIHELAEHYKLASKSYDPEPHRNVIVTATKKSLIPCQTLTEFVSTTKQKIIPLPVSLKCTPSTVDRSETVPDYYND